MFNYTTTITLYLFEIKGLLIGWVLHTPPKPHAFTSLALQSTINTNTNSDNDENADKGKAAEKKLGDENTTQEVNSPDTAPSDTAPSGAVYSSASSSGVPDHMFLPSSMSAEARHAELTSYVISGLETMDITKATFPGDYDELVKKTVDSMQYKAISDRFIEDMNNKRNSILPVFTITSPFLINFSAVFVRIVFPLLSLVISFLFIFNFDFHIENIIPYFDFLPAVFLLGMATIASYVHYFLLVKKYYGYYKKIIIVWSFSKNFIKNNTILILLSILLITNITIVFFL